MAAHAHPLVLPTQPGHYNLGTAGTAPPTDPFQIHFPNPVAPGGGGSDRMDAQGGARDPVDGARLTQTLSHTEGPTWRHGRDIKI